VRIRLMMVPPYSVCLGRYQVTRSFDLKILRRRFTAVAYDLELDLLAFIERRKTRPLHNRNIAPTLRLSLRAITLVFTFSRASAFIKRRSSLVHRRSLVIFFAISVPSSGQESAAIVRQKAPLSVGANSSSPNRILLKVLQRGEGGPIGG
jgi:hypothetical protein